MKKKIVSMALALTLIVTGIPAVPVNATEVSDSAETAVIDELIVSNSEDASISEVVYGESELVCVGENNKAVGNDGVTYDDVMYLSVENVKAMSEDAQRQYVMLCDEIADAKSNGFDIQDVIIAADAEGNLHFQYYVPYAELEDVKNNMVLDAVNDDKNDESLETQTELVTEEVVTETETVEDEAVAETKTEETATEETATEETSTEEATTEEVTTEIKTEETVTEEATTEEVVTETETEEVITEEVVIETEEEETTEVVTEIEEEETTEVVTETETVEIEEVSAFAENMEFLTVEECETFEVADDVKVDKIVDLGYTDNMQLNAATYMNNNYFYNQLRGVEKTVFNAAKSAIVSGRNQFSFAGNRYTTYEFNIAQGISAVILTYPEKTDWMDKLKGYRTSGSYNIRTGAANFIITMYKSKYYNSTLVSKSNAKVKELATAAQEYAKQNHPNNTVYGIVEYFNKWICENNYYNYVGIDSETTYKDVYQYCHTSFGILLKGYGVCESYALAMNRLLDAVGIPNAYVTGETPGGGHAWNYVQMPDGNWYMLDSTWNDDDDNNTYNKDFFLSAGDYYHIAIGNAYEIYRERFIFPTLSTSAYKKVNVSAGITQHTYDIVQGKSVKIQCSSDYVNHVKKTWTSSDKKVATVDKNGKVTAKGVGTATITLNAGGITETCTVNVHQITKVAFNDTNKTSKTENVGIAGDTGVASEAKTYTLAVTQKGNIYTAQQLVDKGVYTAPVVKSSNVKAATATCSLNGNTITLKVQPVAIGSSKVTVKFAGKTITYNIAVKQQINKAWFDTSAIQNKEYTGKAYKPAIKKTTAAPKKITYKVTHKNNINAGTAEVLIKGTGKYTGEFKYTYTIKPLNITTATFKSCTASKVYNGAPIKAATKVVFNKKTLKANKDYDIYYNNSTTAQNVGTYTVKIVGKGNYTGTLTETKEFTIKPNKITKLTVSCKSNIKYTGNDINPVVVKIGKNKLTISDYKVVYHKDTVDGAVVTPKEKGKYVAVITVNGKNIENTATKTQIVKKFTIK